MCSVLSRVPYPVGLNRKFSSHFCKKRQRKCKKVTKIFAKIRKARGRLENFDDVQNFSLFPQKQIKSGEFAKLCHENGNVNLREILRSRENGK